MGRGRVLAILLLPSGAAAAADCTDHRNAGDAAPRSRSAHPGSTWADAADMPDLFTGTWGNFANFFEDDATLNVPFTASAQKYVDAYQHKRDIPYAQEGCRSPGLPIAMLLAGGNKFTYAPGLISIYMQAVGHTRFIRLNEPMGRTSPKYYGNSVGHWEGDTLVVETEDFSPDITFQYSVGKPLSPAETCAGFCLGPAGGGPPRPSLGNLSAAVWGPHGEGMRMVEWMRLVDPQTLEIQTTMYDDTVCTTPHVLTTRRYKRIQQGINERGPFSAEPEEFICSVTVTRFDPDTNAYVDKDPGEMVRLLDKQSQSLPIPPRPGRRPHARR